MASIIQNKFHEILGDFGRPTKFTFHIPPVNNDKSKADIITYSVKSCSLPTMSHEPITIMHKGRSIPIRGTTKFNHQFQVTFYNHENHIVKRFFEMWMMMIEQRHYYYDPRQHEKEQQSEHKGKNSTVTSLPEYLTWYNPTCYIEQRNFDGDLVTAVYQIFNCFPTNVSLSGYDYSAVGQISEVTVDFSCSHFKLFSDPEYNKDLYDFLHGSIVRKNVTANADKIQTYNKDTFAKFNNFQNLDDDASPGAEVYWRPDELARWSNVWNRWTEADGKGNTGAGSGYPSINPDDY